MTMAQAREAASVISVVIPIWNRAHSVARAVESVVSQQVSDGWSVEVIVVDDGSNDHPETVLAQFGDKVRLIRHTTNLGAAAARNSGCAAATGAYIAFLDSDDVWLPEKLQQQIVFMQDRKLAATCTGYLLERSTSQTIVSPCYATGELDLSDLVWGCFVSPGSTLMCRADVFAEVGPLDTNLKRLEDWDWLLRFTLTGRSLGFLAQPLAYVEPSTAVNQTAVLAALDKIHAKHVTRLAASDRRHFNAGYRLARSAALFRSGMKAQGTIELAISWLLSPLRHGALAAVLHNRFAAPQRP
jgi:glycosyltransferase involved in cell wall biosynthesis